MDCFSEITQACPIENSNDSDDTDIDSTYEDDDEDYNREFFLR